jgi:hypothetical protein
MRKGTSGVVGRINKDAFHFARKLLLQRLKCQQVVAKDQPVVEDVILSNAMRGVV